MEEKIEKELACSFNIVLKKEIMERLRDIQNMLTKKFKEKRFYDSSPHVAICTKFMPLSKTNDFLEVIKEEFRNDDVWELGFSKFVSSQNGNFIFLNFSEETTDKILTLNSRALQCSKGIGFEVQGGADEPKYPYFPHISIIKLSDDEIEEAMSLMRDNLCGMKMLVQTYEITVQKDDKKGFAYFPGICKIDLK